MRLAAWVVFIALSVSASASTSAASTESDPVGSFDTASVRLSGVFYYGLVVWDIYGWAADPDVSGQSLAVHVYVDGERFRVIQTGESRPDVGAAFPFAGQNAGWHDYVVVQDGQPHTVCAYAINVGTGTENTTLGCKDIPSSGANTGDPRGVVDAIAVSPGMARFRGWSGDPDSDATTPPMTRLYLDGKPFTDLPGKVARDDVRAVFPELTNVGGFDESLPILPGRHLFCLDAGNGGRNGFNNTSLGCGLIDVPDVQPPNPGEARGNFDALTYQPRTADSSGSTTLEGWAWDPKTNPPYTVRVRALVHGFVTGFLEFQQVSDYQTSEARPDVQRAFPQAPPSTGFKIVFNDGTPDPHTPATDYRCLYALEGQVERFIGCKR